MKEKIDFNKLESLNKIKTNIEFLQNSHIKNLKKLAKPNIKILIIIVCYLIASGIFLNFYLIIQLILKKI